MSFWEILIIIGLVIFVGFIFGSRIYKKIKGEPIDECACCHKNKKKLLKEYHKKYSDKDCCSIHK